MKSKKTSRSKKKVIAKAKKPKRVEKVVEEVSIIERAKSEKNMKNHTGQGKDCTREVFKMWCVLPDQFKGAPDRIATLLGITDSITLELLRISTMQQFAEEFGVIPQTLSRWRKEIETGNDYFDDVKRAFRPLTKNLLAALYRTALEQGDAARAMAWMKIIEDWREQLGVDMSVQVGEGLTDEEKAALNNLIVKNTTTS